MGDDRLIGRFNLQCGYGFGLPVATSITEGGTQHRVQCMVLDRKYDESFGFGLGGAFVHGETAGKLLPVVGVDGTSTANTTNGAVFSVVRMERWHPQGKPLVSVWFAETSGIGLGKLTTTTPGRRLNDGTTVPERSADFTTLDFIDTPFRAGLEIRLGEGSPVALAPFVGLSLGLHHAFMEDTEREEWPYAVRDLTFMVGMDLVIGGDSYAPNAPLTASAEEIAYVVIGQYLLEIPKAYLNQRDLMEPIAQTAALNTMAKGGAETAMAPYTEDLSAISIVLPIFSAMSANAKLAALQRFPDGWRPVPLALEGGRAVLFGALGCFDDTPGKEGYCAEGLNSVGRIGSMLLVHYDAPKYALPIYRSLLGSALAVIGMVAEKPALVSSGLSTFTESAWDPVPIDDSADPLVASTTVTYSPYARLDDSERTAGRAVFRKRTQLGHGMVKAETAVAVAAPQMRVDSLLRRAGVGDEGLPDHDAPGTLRSEIGVGVDIPLGGGVNVHLGAGAHLLAKAQGTATHAGGGVQGDVALEIGLTKSNDWSLSLGCQVVKSWTDDHNEFEVAPAIGIKWVK